MPFPKVVDRKTKRSVELIHTGPMSTTTPSDNKYFMTMIDDFSHFSVYLLKTKSEATSKIKHYVRWTENLFGRKSTAIRSDGGGKYRCLELQQFFESEGIKTQFTIPYKTLPSLIKWHGGEEKQKLDRNSKLYVVRY